MSTMTDRRGLGRGLGELFQKTEPVPSSPGEDGNGSVDGEWSPAPGTSARPVPEGSYFAELPLTAITPNPRQPRVVFDEDSMEELVESIREVGLLQPVVVRPLGEERFELVMGERRWRATQRAGLDAIPAIVRETEEHDLLRDALLENLHRAQLNPLEEAAAYQQMLDDFGCTQEELASRIKRSRPQISNTIRLLRLPATVQRRVAAGVLSAGHARAILAVDDAGDQERLAQRIVAEGMSVRSVEELVALREADASTRPSPGRRPKPPSPRVAELVDRLSDQLETRVRIDQRGRGRGRIVIEFGGSDDLDRLVRSILDHR